MGKITKKDILVLIACMIFVLMNLGAIGSTGRKRARELVCLSNLLKWGRVFEIYTNSNDGKFPTRTGVSGRWINTSLGYYGDNNNIRLCPMATKLANPDMSAGVDWWGGTFLGWGKIPVWDAGGGRTFGIYGSYGLNGYVYVPGEARLYGKPAEIFWGTPNVAGASGIPMLLDCYFWEGWPDYTNIPPYYDGHQNRIDADAMNRFCINRHNGAINCLFLDFSARKVGLKELWILQWHRNFNTEGPWTTAGGATSEDWPDWMRNFKEF